MIFYYPNHFDDDYDYCEDDWDDSHDPDDDGEPDDGIEFYSPDDDGDLEFDDDTVIRFAPFDVENSSEALADTGDSSSYDEDADSVPF